MSRKAHPKAGGNTRKTKPGQAETDPERAARLKRLIDESEAELPVVAHVDFGALAKLRGLERVGYNTLLGSLDVVDAEIGERLGVHCLNEGSLARLPKLREQLSDGDEALDSACNRLRTLTDDDKLACVRRMAGFSPARHLREPFVEPNHARVIQDAIRAAGDAKPRTLTSAAFRALSRPCLCLATDTCVPWICPAGPEGWRVRLCHELVQVRAEALALSGKVSREDLAAVADWRRSPTPERRIVALGALQAAATPMAETATREGSRGNAEEVPGTGVSVNQSTVGAQSASVRTKRIPMEASTQKPPRQRKKREVVQPLIADHLMRRPHDTAEQVAEAVGWSVGVVGESTAWKLNQQRLKIANRDAIDPKAVRLNERTVNAAGGNPRQQKHAAYQNSFDVAGEIDEREQELFRRIDEYQQEHPEATPQEIAAALGCTAGEVECRQAILDRLMAEQTEDHLEDVDVEDPESKRGTRRKWVNKRP